MSDGLTVLWRGPLSGCNYACPYCPFAKRKDSRAGLATDKAALDRFADWAMARPHPLSILFTPWGEALIRRHYRDAMTRLSHAPHIATVAIQTNLSAPIGWLADCDLTTLALWATYHPGETDRPRFLAKIEALEAMGARYSVGAVALPAHFDAIERLREDLPASAYLWINAEDRLQGCYSPDQVERLAAIDPLFELNDRAWPSRGRACRAGAMAISVDGDGTARRCHFLKEPIGNIYDPGFTTAATPAPCPAAACNCHIGYSHLEALAMETVFGPGLIERRAAAPDRATARRTIAAFDAAGPATALPGASDR